MLSPAGSPRLQKLTMRAAELNNMETKRTAAAAQESATGRLSEIKGIFLVNKGQMTGIEQK